MGEARVLLYDLEITPILGWTYDLWDARVVKVERQPYLMCAGYKWLGDAKTKCVAQIDFPNYADNPHSDYQVAAWLRDLMDEADVVVAHNARKFDNRIATARFLDNGLEPPSPYKTVDTLTVARRYFRFGSNSLNDLCERFGIGTKTEQTHGKLWRDCVDGDPKAWKLMKRYCKQDVDLLEALYLKLLPYISNHPNVALMAGKEDGCPKCGSDKLQYRGYCNTGVSQFRRVQCQQCGGWSRERIAQPEKTTYVNVTW